MAMGEGKSFYSVVAVDDHPMILESIRTSLSATKNLQLLATASSGAEGLQLVRQTGPDFAIVDVDLPGLDGLELVRRLRAYGQEIGIVMISGGNPIQDAALARLAGADAYVSKAASTSSVTAALDLLCDGYSTFPTASISCMGPNDDAGFGSLTKRESRVWQLLLEGHSNVDIAARLGISPKTVSTFKHRISRKMHAPPRG